VLGADAAAVNELQLQLPAWADLIKTGTFKELGPLDPDWYYTRAGEFRDPGPCRAEAADARGVKAERGARSAGMD